MRGRSHCIQDTFEHCFGLVQDIVVPKTHDMPTVPLQISSSVIVVMQLPSMLPAIQLDNDLLLYAREINEEPTDRMLPSKFVSAQSPAAQMVP